MAFNHRKMLVSHLPRKDFNLTVFIPCFQIYTPPPSPPQSYLSLIVSTTICVVGFVLLFFFLVVMLYLYITDLRRSSAATVAPGDTNRGEDENDAEETGFSSDHNVWRITRFTTVGLHRSAIDSITVVGFKKGNGIIDGTECSVCLNAFEEDESLRLLPKCSHAFHINCIDTWLLSHKNCPLCRAPVLLPEPPHQSNNDLGGDEESSGSRNTYILPRTQSDLVNQCGSGCLETVRNSFSIGGPSSLKAGDSDDLC